MRVLLILCLLLFVADPVAAQMIIAPSSSADNTIAATVGVTSAQVVAVSATRRVIVAIDNESTSATIACAFGATAALNTAGSFTIPPGVTRVWDGTFVPSDAINCIASAGSTPVTVEAH